MGHLHAIDFNEEASDIKEYVTAYWTKRADSFMTQRQRELSSMKACIWEHEILSHAPKSGPLKILDAGCGAGYFEILFGSLHHEITGIDLTPEMIVKANEMISDYGLNPNRVKAICMDAEKPQFEDESFDMVITRNLTWTLPHPIDAYTEWFRVLKKGGVLLNFDAEYAKYAHENMSHPENMAHKCISDELKDECHDIYHMLTISALDRPQWDSLVLSKIGFREIHLDTDAYRRIFAKIDEFYAPDEMFMIKAVK